MINLVRYSIRQHNVIVDSMILSSDNEGHTISNLELQLGRDITCGAISKSVVKRLVLLNLLIWCTFKRFINRMYWIVGYCHVLMLHNWHIESKTSESFFFPLR